MNKIASTYYLQTLGLPTFDIITTTGNERELEEICKRNPDSRWVIRCGLPPDMNAPMERPLPWDVASDLDLIERVKKMQKEVGSGYLVFIHPQREMPRAGNMLIFGSEIIIESCKGNYVDLSNLSHGMRDPDEILYFNLGMMDFRREKEENLTVSDIYELRCAEKLLDYVGINALTSPVKIEFSFGNGLKLHDVIVGRR